MSWRDRIGRLRRGTLSRSDLLFRDAENLLLEGEYKKALQELDQIETGELETADQLRCSILRSRCLIGQGSLETALEISEKVVENYKEIPDYTEYVVDALIIGAEALWRLGKFDESIEIIEQGEKILQILATDNPSEAKSREALFLYYRAIITRNKGDFDGALEYYQQSYTLFEKLDMKPDIASVLAGIGMIYARRGELDQALEHFKKSLTLREELGNRQEIAKSLNNIGLIYMNKGDLDQALDYFRQSIVLFEEIGNKQVIAVTLNNIALIYQNKGELEQALAHFSQSLEIVEELGNKQLIAFVTGNMGAVYSDLGKLDQALEYYQQELEALEELGNKQDIAKSLEHIASVYNKKGYLEQALEYYQRSLVIFEEIGNRQEIGSAFLGIGLVHWNRGELDPASEYLQRSLTILEEVDNKQDIAEVLFHLVSLNIEKNTIDQAQQYLERLQQINEQEDNKIISLQFRIANALVLRRGKRTRHRVKAEEILDQIVDEEIVDHQLTVIALLNLCDLLLVEIYTSGDEGALKDMQNRLNILIDIAISQNSHWLLAETHVLHSKLSLMGLDIPEARRLLTEAEVIANRHGLGRLAMKISIEHDALLSELSRWEELSERQAPLAERAKLARVDEQLVRMFRHGAVDVPEIPEEEPVLLLILAEGGLSLYSRTFSTSAGVDEQMIAGFLNAIQSFSTEVFSQTLDRIKLQAYTLLIKFIPPFTLCYVFKGQSYSAHQKLTKFIEIAPQTPRVWGPLLEILETCQTLSQGQQAVVDALLDEVFFTPVSS